MGCDDFEIEENEAYVDEEDEEEDEEEAEQILPKEY